MTLVRDIVKEAAIGVGVADTPEELSAIRQPGEAAAICRRQPMPDFQSRIDGLDADALPQARVILRPEAVRGGVAEICGASGTLAGRERDRLVDDIAALADIFAGLMRARWLRLSAVAVNTDGRREIIGLGVGPSEADTFRAELLRGA